MATKEQLKAWADVLTDQEKRCWTWGLRLSFEVTEMYAEKIKEKYPEVTPIDVCTIANYLVDNILYQVPEEKER